MSVAKYVNTVRNKYLNLGLDIRALSFNVLTFAGMAAGIIVAVLSALTRAGGINIAINLVFSALSFFMLRVVEKKKCYRLCSWITIIAVYMIAFPVLFFASGGYRSGMPSLFMLAVVFTAILLEKHERIAALIFEFALYIVCCLTAYYFPATVSKFPSELNYVHDVIIGMVVSSTLLLSAIILHFKIYYGRQLHMQELNRELEKRNETLARHDIIKNDFLGTVAHEINTPLAIISASSNDTLDLLMETPINIDEIIENQRIIERKIKLIDNILLDLMDIVAIENGRFPLRRQPMYLPELLRNVCDAQFKHLDVNNNELVYEIQPNLSHIWADPQRIEQTVINLLSNAVRHTKQGIIKIKLEKNGQTQIVSVSDNGEGMDSEMARVVLGQYVSTKVDYWRHGIGLYICRKIITAHGGDIWIDSEKGWGTCVSFSLKEGSEYE